MDEQQSIQSIPSVKRFNKSFSIMDNMSKDDSYSAIGRRSWRKRDRSYTTSLHIIPQPRARSVSGVNSMDSVDVSSWSDSSDSSQDHLTLLKGGRFLFQSHTSIEHVQNYLLLNAESSMDEVVQAMARTWRLPVPKVIVSVISNVDYFIMPNESLLEDLEQGILQSAQLTKMWILTDGLNYGAARLFGEAVAHEKMRRRLNSAGQVASDLESDDHIAAIGVVTTDQLGYGPFIEDYTRLADEGKTLVLENVGDDRRELNPHHSYSLILSSTDSVDKEAIQNLKYNLEARFSQLLGAPQHKGKRLGESVSASKLTEPRESLTTPVVGVMIQGGPGEIERVLWLIKKQIPVVVILRKEYASGLLAYAYKEYFRGDMNRVEQILKPQLMSRVKEAFPDYCGDNELLRQQVRDKILECAKVAVQSDKQLLFILDPNSPDEDLKDLNTFILAAIFSSQKPAEGLNRESIHWTLRLALRWNRVDFVTKRILNPNYISRFRVRDDLFVEALLLRDREEFVELFLDLGFLLQRLMTYEQVLRLFEASLNEEFFVTICLQNILLKKKTELGTKFMHETNCELNRLLCALSGLKGLVEPSYLLIPQIGNRANSNALEKRALLTVLYWAVLTNRKGLVKVLWKRSAEPIAVALVISNMYYRMSKFWIKDTDLKVEIKQNAIEFGELAIKMMDLTFNDSRLLAFHSLTNPIPEFNNLNVVDLALIGNNIFFIAHPCCQRSMRERWFGNIKIKSYGTSTFYVPEFLKIYLCLLLVFPMYFWLSFKPERRAQVPAVDDDDEKEGYTKNMPNTKNISYSEWITRRAMKSEPYASPNILMKIYYLWTAPITKFWVNQLFVLAYLFLYAIAVMLPYCGHPNVNWCLCGWTMVLIIENVTRNLQRRQKFPTMSIMWPLVEFLAEVSTVGVLLLHLLGGHLNFTTYKLLMALSMLAIYFCALRDMLTASPKLGPMLVNITELTRKDMINWIRLWMLCLISGGLAIHAVIYPAQPFTMQALGRALLRATLGIWLTDIDDLEGDTTCSSLYETKEISHTCNASSISPFALRRLENCPYASMAGYVMVIQYITITRLLFYTLMFAMFSATINRTQIRSVELWKYQFQSIVTEFESRPVIPAPLNIITYPFRLSYFLGNVALEIMLECSTCCKELVRSRKDQLTSIPYNQWKSYLAQISREGEMKQDNVTNVISVLEEESDNQQVAIKHLTDYLVQIERHQTMTAVYLEDLKKKLEALDPKVRAQTQHGGRLETHSLARQSPYPGTDIQKFPLLDKDVPWEVSYEAYDPDTYSKPVDEFPIEEQPFVDIDILSLPMVGGQYQTMVPPLDTDANVLDPTTRSQHQIEVLYNAVQTLVLPSGQEVTIDRRSYMMDSDNQPLTFDVDSSGVPINPMGRTGLRGRGLLPRWGPNHWIKAVISRLKTVSGGSSSSSNGHSAVGGSQESPKAVLEILVRHSPDTGGISLIGGRVRPDRSTYSTLCDILTDIYPDESADHGLHADQEEMIHTFSKFASNIYGKKSKAGYATYGYSAFLVYRGYEDTQVNTDNAWQESEIFNFHYKHKDGFNTRAKHDENVVWQTVSDQMPFIPSDMAAVREAGKIRTRAV